MSNWPDKRALGGDLLSRRGGARAAEPDDRQRRDRRATSCSTAAAPPACARTVAGEQREFAGREIIVSLGAHPLAGDADACRHRPGRASARARHRGARRHARRRRAICRTIRSCSSASICQPRARQSPALRPHPTTVLRFSSGVPGCPPTDMYINVQSKTSWSALGQRIANLAPALLEAGWRAAAWRCARPSRGRAAGRDELRRPRARSASAS